MRPGIDQLRHRLVAAAFSRMESNRHTYVSDTLVTLDELQLKGRSMANDTFTRARP